MDFDDNDLVNEQLKPVAYISIKSDLKISLKKKNHHMKLRATTFI
jgi:hypothetical protein